MRGWTTNEIAYNYKNHNLWGENQIQFRFHTFDWSKNMLTNNLLAIFFKKEEEEEEERKERRKKEAPYKTFAHLIVDLDCYAWMMLYQVL